MDDILRDHRPTELYDPNTGKDEPIAHRLRDRNPKVLKDGFYAKDNYLDQVNYVNLVDFLQLMDRYGHIHDHWPEAAELRTRAEPEAWQHDSSQTGTSVFNLSGERALMMHEHQENDQRSEWSELLTILKNFKKKRKYVQPETRGLHFLFEHPKDVPMPEYSNCIEYVHEDFFDNDFSKVVSTAANMNLKGPLSGEFYRFYHNKQYLFEQHRKAGQTAMLGPAVTNVSGMRIFYLLVKPSDFQIASPFHLATALLDLRRQLTSHGINKIAISMVEPGNDGLPWALTYALITQIFHKTGITFLAYTHFMTNSLYGLTTMNVGQPTTEK